MGPMAGLDIAEESLLLLLELEFYRLRFYIKLKVYLLNKVQQEAGNPVPFFFLAVLACHQLTTCSYKGEIIEWIYKEVKYVEAKRCILLVTIHKFILYVRF